MKINEIKAFTVGVSWENWIFMKVCNDKGIKVLKRLQVCRPEYLLFGGPTSMLTGETVDPINAHPNDLSSYLKIHKEGWEKQLEQIRITTKNEATASFKFDHRGRSPVDDLKPRLVMVGDFM